MQISKKNWSVLLTIEIFFLVFVSGFLPSGIISTVNALVFVLIYFTSVMSIHSINRNFFLLVWLSMGMQLISRIFNLPEMITILQITNILFFSAIVALLINRIAMSKNVSEGAILEAVNGYLLLGIMFAAMIGLLVQYDPGSFKFTVIEDETNYKFIYFSFVTLTTLGYGDVVPVAPSAKSLSILISVTGQLYLTIIIALLVGKYSSQKHSTNQ